MKKIFATIIIAVMAVFAFAQTRTEVKSTDLPKKTTDYIAQNMKGFTIDKAFKMENKAEISYTVFVMKGTEKHKMHFDKDGNFIKSAVPVEEKKIEAAPAPKPKEQKPAKETPVAKPAGK